MAVTDAATGIRAPRIAALQLRDRLLPDLLAVSMLMTAIRGRLDSGTLDDRLHELLEDMTSTLDVDVSHVRALIADLSTG